LISREDARSLLPTMAVDAADAVVMAKTV